MIFFRFDYRDISENFLLDFFMMSIVFHKASFRAPIISLENISSQCHLADQYVVGLLEVMNAYIDSHYCYYIGKKTVKLKKRL